MLGANAIRRGVLVIFDGKDSQAEKISQRFRILNASVITFQDFPKLQTTDRQFDGISIFCNADENFLDLNLLSKCFGLLTPGGMLNNHVRTFGKDISIVEKLQKLCLYSGFFDYSYSFDSNLPDPVVISIVCKKPEWKLGVAAKVDGEFIDDSLLVQDTDVYIPLGKGRDSSCASKPRACATCTCGRAELEKELGAEEAKKRLESGSVRSSCGSCYLGDAFRCASCPYRGLPAFKPGEKVLLDLEQSNTGQTDVVDHEIVGVSDGTRVTLTI